MKKAPGTGKTVALTFDDGPGQATPQILSILKQARVRATFFQTGLHATDHPDLVREVAAAGHLVANHSFEHKYPASVPGGWTETYVSSEISKTASILGKIANKPICFFRPPGGYTTNIIAAAQKNGMTAVMWNLDSMDWKQPGTTTPDATSAIVRAATNIGNLNQVNLLMHDSKASGEPEGLVSSYRGNTVAALPIIIDYYKKAGFTFVDLLGNT
ncbi:MAG: polysaccharide deacetylase family protein [Candidatus Saccharimonadales bacterium]|jgi:peptidoglycan/xylan/chitin deacetylase (PgdA/CDA1 family)